MTSAELFDPATSSFSTVGRMKTNHYLGTRLADGRVLVTGGQGDAGEILALAEIIGFLPAGRDMPILALRKQTYSLCGRRRRPE